MGFEGTGALKKSNQVARDTTKALKQLSSEVVHPAVRKEANKVLKNSKRYLSNLIFGEFIDNAINNFIGYGTQKVVDMT